MHVRPELVVKVAFNDVQRSPQYPPRLALRFARVKGYRTDKAPADAMRGVFRPGTGKVPPGSVSYR